jgi:hypothetical protein
MVYFLFHKYDKTSQNYKTITFWLYTILNDKQRKKCSSCNYITPRREYIEETIRTFYILQKSDIIYNYTEFFPTF